MAYTKGYRYGILPGQNNANVMPLREIKSLTYAATISAAPTQEITKYELALTGAATINADKTATYAVDELTFILTADGTNRVVTFGTNFVSAGTVTVVASKSATITFIYSSVMDSWVETGRFVQS